MLQQAKLLRPSTTLALILALLLAGPAIGRAEVLMTKDEALAAGLGKAERVEKEVLFLSDAERQEVQQKARAELKSQLFTVYKGMAGDAITGYAFIDTRTVRSKPATFMVVLSPEGKVRELRVLAWKEPPEYRPSGRWLAQFEGHGLEPHTALGREIQGMSGASLSSRTLTDGVRRVLAVYRVKLAEGG
ncbi:FMN-binding protein [Thiohalorhabdus methylotrophus]|uniref:FMN-binding protein n=1 Tax=Thiohalorhabdus methylotrophus TaxID=3242694 RepID=A0ABV4TZ43_9GAMM